MHNSPHYLQKRYSVEKANEKNFLPPQNYDIYLNRTIFNLNGVITFLQTSKKSTEQDYPSLNIKTHGYFAQHAQSPLYIFIQDYPLYRQEKSTGSYDCKKYPKIFCE